MNLCASKSHLTNCINKMKSKMIESAEKNGYGCEETISYSQKLDKLIIKDMRFCCTDDIGILINAS